MSISLAILGAYVVFYASSVHFFWCASRSGETGKSCAGKVIRWVDIARVCVGFALTVLLLPGIFFPAETADGFRQDRYTLDELGYFLWLGTYLIPALIVNLFSTGLAGGVYLPILPIALSFFGYRLLIFGRLLISKDLALIHKFFLPISVVTVFWQEFVTLSLLLASLFH